jgi:hypothetical protein
MGKGYTQDDEKRRAEQAIAAQRASQDRNAKTAVKAAKDNNKVHDDIRRDMKSGVEKPKKAGCFGLLVIGVGLSATAATAFRLLS